VGCIGYASQHAFVMLAKSGRGKPMAGAPRSPGSGPVGNFDRVISIMCKDFQPTIAPSCVASSGACDKAGPNCTRSRFRAHCLALCMQPALTNYALRQSKDELDLGAFSHYR